MQTLPKNGIALATLLLFVSAPAIAQKTIPRKPAVVNKLQTTYKNGIKIKANGFKVAEAYLLFDDGSRVPSNNRVALNQRINMRVIIDSGWTDIEGKAFPGAGEVIKLSGGYEVIKADDLFETFSESGVDITDARYITLKAIVTELSDKKQYAIVSFRIWDKKGSAELTGSYKFFLK